MVNVMEDGKWLLRICLAFAFVFTIGLVLNHLIVNLIAGQMIMFSYKFVITPILICVPVFTMISIAVSGIAVRKVV